MAEKDRAALRAPSDAAELRAFLKTRLGLEFPERGIIDGHHSPADYLAWSFFEGRRGWADPEPPAGSGNDCVVWANRGGGKTFLGAVATMLDLVFKPGIEVRILGGSLDQSRRMYAHLRRLFSRKLLAGLVDGRIARDRLALRNGSEVELLAQSQASVRGTRVQKLRCDEVELFDPEVWEAAQLATRGRVVKVAGVGEVKVRGSVEAFSTMHQPHGLMWTLVREAREGVGGRRLFKWGVVDVLERCGEEHTCKGPGGECPLWGECRGRAKKVGGGHVTVSDAIGMKRRACAATWAAEMLCLRPRRTDAVLPEFDVRAHVVDALPWESGAWVPGAWVAGMDFGFRSPTVVLLAAVSGSGTVCVVRERHVSGALIAEHAASIRRGLGGDDGSLPPGPGWRGMPAWIGVDPAGRQRNEQTGISSATALEREGFTVRDARLPLHEGLELVRARLKPADGSDPRLVVHRGCVKLIESLERYHYPSRRPESDEPEKDGPDHAADALRYLVQNLDRPKWVKGWKYA